MTQVRPLSTENSRQQRMQVKGADGKEVWKNADGKDVDSTKAEDLLSKLTSLRADSFESTANAALKKPELVVTIRFDENKAEQVTLARCLTKLPHLLASLAKEADHASDIPDPALKKPEQRQAAYLRGLVAGLQGQTVPHSLSGVPPIPPEQGRCYEAGYAQGQGLAQVIGAWKQGQEQRKEAVMHTAAACLTNEVLHLWREEYYGWRCQACHTFIPFGSEPWGPVLGEEDEEDDVCFSHVRKCGPRPRSDGHIRGGGCVREVPWLTGPEPVRMVTTLASRAARTFVEAGP